MRDMIWCIWVSEAENKKIKFILRPWGGQFPYFDLSWKKEKTSINWKKKSICSTWKIHLSQNYTALVKTNPIKYKRNSALITLRGGGGGGGGGGGLEDWRRCLEVVGGDGNSVVTPDRQSAPGAWSDGKCWWCGGERCGEVYFQIIQEQQPALPLVSA